ncbi:MAG: MFS transporter, partial [Clostridia bacterium]|nr:MFS transporter [Clostridia bacterium]
MALLLVVIYVTFISLGLPDSLFGVAWPLAHVDFGLPESFGSVYSVIIALCAGGVSFFAGPLIKKFGTGIVTAVSVVMTAIGLLIISFAPNVYVMMLGSVISGLGGGAIDTGLNNFVALRYKAIHMNWLHCFWGVGVTISPLIMSVFLKDGSWQGGYRTVSYIQFGNSALVYLS